MANAANILSLHTTSKPEGGITPAQAPRILIVDDVEDNRMVLARRFERRGYSIAEADCGMAALAAIEGDEFDLVLLDVMMPDLEGTEVLRRIRETRSSAELPVIMVTARTASEDIVHALKAGADDYITKPVDFAVALARVDAQVARRRAEQKVLHASKALEERVRERTQDLMRINEQLLHEITQRERSEAESRFLALHDPLTGLPNRARFQDDLVQAIGALGASGQDLAILFIDLDGFKNVNDTLGHPVGDELLRRIGQELTTKIPEGALLARLGGDEFAVLLEAPTQVSTATALARDIVHAAAALTKVGDNDVSIGASIGIAVCNDPATGPDVILRNADVAMYRAKKEGRGTWRVYDPKMDEHDNARRQLEQDMRRALQVGEFRTYFQPIVHLQSRRIASFETLVRWEHPTRGLISPVEFIPIAEENGLIVPLGEWVIREACTQAATWPESLSVAVNLSPVQFAKGNVVATITNALAASGLSPRRFEVEITESTLLERSAQNLEIIKQIRALGVRISMDDFGTGYSSLDYLRSFSFDKIKIDRSFVKDIPTSSKSRAIIDAIAGLSRQFGLRTTVEGVETTDQLEYIAGEGCSEVQGKIFSMPVPADEVFQLIRRIGVIEKKSDEG